MTKFIAGILIFLSLAHPGLAGEPRQIEVGLTTHLGDQQSFVDGDRIAFLLSLGSDAYVYLFYRDAGAKLLQLLPTDRMPDHFFEAGWFMPVPSARQRFQFRVQPPYGDEVMYAVASDNGELVFPGKQLANGLILLPTEIETVIAGIKANSTELFGRAELRLTTLPAQQ